MGKRSLGLLVQELVKMAEEDQAMRVGAQKQKIKFDPGVDRTNTQKLKGIIAEIGWPTIGMVGEKASYAAWLIVQHADFDLSFQEYCLGLMVDLPPGDVLRSNVAYLTDRVAVNKGIPQTFGTQFHSEDGILKPWPIKDIKNLEKRRRGAGLESFRIYRRKMEGVYRWPKQHVNPKVGSLHKVS